MKDWAFASESYIKNGTFEYSTTMLSKMRIMANKTQVEALNELQHYGFIQKENNARKDGGITQEWSFSCEWYNGTKGEYKKKYPPKDKGENKQRTMVIIVLCVKFTYHFTICLLYVKFT